MYFLPALPYILGLFALFWCIGIYALFVTYKKVPRYTLAEARETAKKDTRDGITTLLAFIITPVPCWFLFGKDAPQSFFIAFGCLESLGLLIVLVDFTSARLAKKNQRT